ncbi:MAG TPA: HD domain-containing phosphohydrolase [Candidatus Sulfomarinibacteraceae bacterium]|nr:HD domain-containing phosphohydrolase [Candidatus Sulfomarinibacteraceae bacterium]
MTISTAPRGPATERALKEVLYRFMGEVQATKAALYLPGARGGWQLATQYGFGRRDALAEHLGDEDHLVRMVRAFATEPRFYNGSDAAELAGLADYLAGARSSRVMLVPLTAEGELVGFVDVRDKGRQVPFVANDLELAGAIGAELARLVSEAGADAPGDPEQTVEPMVEAVAAEPASAPADALLDDSGLDELRSAGADALADPRVVAVALTLAGPGAAATLIQQREGSPAADHRALLRHQEDAMQRAAVPVPPPAAWRTEVRRHPGQLATDRFQFVASAVLLDGGSGFLVASVVAGAEAAVARQALERLRGRARAAQERSRLRLVRRGLARRLLQPGDRRYPELVAHCLGVSRLAWGVARALDLDDDAVEAAALAGLLHDVGMRELDYDRLYLHPTPGPEDRRTYRLHVEVGERIVRVDGFGDVADAVRHHHERWDGNGYPDQLARDRIPMLARIVHAAEVFDLFTAANSYRPAVSRERALAILRRAAGHQFDPAVVDALARVVA